MGKDSGGGGETSVVSTAPEWLQDLGKWSSDKFKDQMGKQEGYSPYPDMRNPYGKWESLYGQGTGKDYLDAFSAAPKAAYNQALTDTKNMFGAKGVYGSVGNGMMSGAMSSAGEKYATAMSDAQIKAQNAQAVDYYTSAEGRKWANQNKADALNYENTMRQQLVSNYLASMGVSVPSIVQGATVMQDDGGGGDKGGLGGLGALAGGAMSMFCARDLKEDKKPAEPVLEKVRQLPVERWRYKAGTGLDRAEHMGPYAEDWARLFGGSNRKISYIDAIGVCLKAIQELAGEVAELNAIINTGRAA